MLTAAKKEYSGMLASTTSDILGPMATAEEDKNRKRKKRWFYHGQNEVSIEPRWFYHGQNGVSVEPRWFYHGQNGVNVEPRWRDDAVVEMAWCI